MHIISIIKRMAVLAASLMVMLIAPTTAAASDCYHDWSELCAGADHKCQNGDYAYYDEGALTDPGGTNICDSGARVRVCVRKYGDHVYVKDIEADGRAAIGEVTTSDGTIRYCRNDQGANVWVHCNFDWAELYHTVLTGTFHWDENHVEKCYYHYLQHTSYGW